MPDTTLLGVEKCLAAAHAALWRASQLAETLRDQSLADDLHQLTSEVGRINVDLLTGSRSRAHPPSTVRT